jgi:hypothetical protein
MKNTLILISIILLSSCGQSPNNANGANSDTNQQSNDQIVDLNTFPKDWVRLTEKNGKLVIYNSCEGGNLLLTFSKKQDHFELLAHGQQEDENFEIIESTHTNDTVYMKTKSLISGNIIDYKFTWIDKEKGLGRFITISKGHKSDELFVTSEKQTNFEVIDQPCRECWGDECDEIAAKTINQAISENQDCFKKNDFNTRNSTHLKNILYQISNLKEVDEYSKLNEETISYCIVDYNYNNEGIYKINVGLDLDSHFSTRYVFYANRDNYDIRILEVVRDTIMTLDDWRNASWLK